MANQMRGKDLLVALVLAGVSLLAATGAWAVSISSRTAQTIDQLESLQDAGFGNRGRAQFNRLFDNNQAALAGVYPVQVSAPSVIVAPGQSLSAISAQKKINDSIRVSQILADKAARSSGYYPGSGYPGYGYPGYGHYRPSLGDRIVDGTRSLFNNLEAGWNNFKHGLARAIEPRYPYVTRYNRTATPWGTYEQPVYRYRPGAIDIPGYGSYRPGYGYPGYPGYGYPGYGYYPPRLDYGGFYGYRPGYEWRQGYGYIPESVFTSAFSGQYRFVPQTRGGGTIEPVRN